MLLQFAILHRVGRVGVLLQFHSMGRERGAPFLLERLRRTTSILFGPCGLAGEYYLTTGASELVEFHPVASPQVLYSSPGKRDSSAGPSSYPPIHFLEELPMGLPLTAITGGGEPYPKE